MKRPLFESGAYCNYTHSTSSGNSVFRVVHAALFLKHFSSDRMHMFDSKTKTWSAPPPEYHCIQPTKENNLMTYMTMAVEDVLKNITVKKDNPFGVVYTLPQLLSRFLKPGPS